LETMLISSKFYWSVSEKSTMTGGREEDTSIDVVILMVLYVSLLTKHKKVSHTANMLVLVFQVSKQVALIVAIENRNVTMLF
jgi:hypothetical protein